MRNEVASKEIYLDLNIDDEGFGFADISCESTRRTTIDNENDYFGFLC